MKKLITVWERYNKQKNSIYKWQHNHLDNGFSDDQNEPIPTCDFQKKSWSGGKWRKFKAYLINSKVEIER